MVSNLKAYENNLSILRQQPLKNKSIADIHEDLEKYHIGFKTLDEQFYGVDKLKIYNNPIINGLLKIKKTWEAELTELTK